MTDGGSDFNPSFFSKEENTKFQTILERLRSFEAAVCSQFRKLENSLRTNDNVAKSKLSHLESSLQNLDETEELKEFEMEEKLVKMNEKVEASSTEFELFKATVGENLNQLSLKIENQAKEARELLDSMDEKIETLGKDLKFSIDVVETRVEFLEIEKMGNSSLDEYWFDSGPEKDPNLFTHGSDRTDEQTKKDEEEKGGTEEKEDDEMDIMMADPFLMTVIPPGVYDGNPTVSFSRWCGRFKDLLSLYPQLTEPQKINRLRISLSGQARAEMEGMNPAPNNLQEVIEFLKRKFENDNTKSIARQALSLCKQAPGEKVYEFANRLSEALRSALSGENEETVKKRMFEEFMERLTPDLQFEVKAGRPTDYSNAYEMAQHFELLLASRKTSHVSVAELSSKVEALAIQTQRGSRRREESRVCYYCNRPGHLVRDCRLKRGEGRSNENRQFYQRGDRGVGRNWTRDYRSDRNENNRWGKNEYRNDNPWEKTEYRNGNPERPNWRPHRSPTPVQRKPMVERAYPRRAHRSPSSDGEESDRPYSPGKRVQFKRGRIVPARVASPLFLALIAFVALFSVGRAVEIKAKPMVCLPDAPISYWSLPVDPICPNWVPTQIPISFELNVYRPNTVQYKTEAMACSCIRTKVSRRRGFFGSTYEEVSAHHLEVPTAICKQMTIGKDSPAGNLGVINGTLKGTNNSLQIGWGSWPSNWFWTTKEIDNCYVYKTIVFTRHGMEGLSTPIEECPSCVYKSGACRCTKSSLIWTPDKTHLCSFVWLSRWIGEYASLIWTTNSGDFALSFENISAQSQPGCYPEPGELILSDQAFAVPSLEFRKMVEKARKGSSEHRVKRESIEIGPVYSSQLAAQLTALSVKMALTTQRLFTETIRKICTSMQIMADQMLTLSIANPSLLARYFLGNPFVSARLVTDKFMEVKTCFPVYEGDMHFNWQKGHCFEYIPVTFDLYRQQKHGFIDPNTQIIHHKSKEVDCDRERYAYLEMLGMLIQYDQKTGDIKQIPSEAIRELTRHGKIDIPEINPSFFKNKVLANLTELYSRENFKETVKSAKIIQEIARLSKMDSWESSSEHTDRIANGIVTSGLFSFLRGGLFSFNQLWIFCCCCYVTMTIAVQLLLPLATAQALQYLNLGGIAFRTCQQIWTLLGQRETQKGNVKAIETADGVDNSKKEEASSHELTLSVNRLRAIPLTERWPSPEGQPKNLSPVEAPTRGSKTGSERKIMKVSVLAIIGQNTKCDKNFKIEGTINGVKMVFLLDTGAHVSICSLQTAEKFGAKELYTPEVAGVIGISDELVPVIGCSNIQLELAGSKIITEVSVIEKEVGKRGAYDMIIGRNTFRKMPFYLDLQDGHLIKKSQEILKYDGSEKNTLTTKSPTIENRECGEAEGIKLEICLKENSKAFSKHEYDLGTCQITAPKILTKTEVPERSKPYPVPEKYEAELKNCIKKMLHSGVIKESHTPWVHNVVLVKKPNGQLRPCVDFRPLNKVTIPDPYPLPRMEKVIYHVAGKKYYSSLDLASGFWQIPLDPESSYKCGIITPWGVYQMLKLPFGLCNAPSIFQRTMDKILDGIENVSVYIDDILIHSNTLECHLKSLEEIFRRLQTYGLKLKREKCNFLQKKCHYLGHILSEVGYQPSLGNKEVIENFPEPTNVKDVKRFLGMASFFRKFIPGFASIAHPLNQLTRGHLTSFEWGEKERGAMNELKRHLLKAPCLRPPNYDQVFYLFTDASAIAYGGALMQTKNGTEMHAVSFWSRTLTPTESKLPPTHGELAAIVHAIQNFRSILYGADLVVLTDHRPLTFLFQKSSTNPKLNRWLMALQEYEPQVIYIEGKANKIADALSRVPIPWESVETKIKEEIPYVLITESSLNRRKFEKETREDPVLMKVITKIKENWVEPIEGELEPFYKNRDKLYVESGIIKKHPQGQFVVPESLKNAILELIHKAHFGIVRSKSKARKYVWWPRMSEDIENFVKECVVCQRNGVSPPRTDPGHRWPEAKIPFERVHADLAGPIWGTNFLIMVDSYSRYPFAVQTNSTGSATLIALFREIFGLFGSPKTLVTDNGPQFTSVEFEGFLVEEGINHLTSPTYHPASNGEAERFVRTFKEGMKKLLDEGRNLRIAQFILLQEYRSSPCATLNGNSPAQLFLKREMRTSFDKIKISQLEVDKGTPIGDTMSDKGGRKPPKEGPKYEPGDSVWVRDQQDKKWTPAVLFEPIGERMWRMELEGGGERTAHVDQIKARRTIAGRA